MELRQLEYVVGIVDHGGFTAAARALHVSQPALSQAIRTLETELGIDLFLRSGRTVSLTVAGEALLGPARQTLRDIATARAAVADVAGNRAGHLDIVCLPTLAVDPVAGLIGRFRGAHPGVTVRLAEPEDPGSIESLVTEGSAEIGCTDLIDEATELTVIDLAPQRYLAILPPGSPGSSRAIPLSTLARMPLITTPTGTSTRRLLDDALAIAAVVPELAVETDHREVIADLVISGAGAAILPEPLAAAAATRGAVARPVTPPISRRVAIVHRSDTLSPAGDAFIALSRGQPGSLPS